MKIDEKSALIVVDIQKDFTPGGALAVPDGDKIIPVVNKYIEEFRKRGAKIFATRDWHPENHISFRERGGPWPPHCVQNTEGAQFHPDLKLPDDAEIISKAFDPDKEAYSGFQGTELDEKLKSYGVEKVFVCGLATDYCVKNTVLDAIKNGYKTFLLLDAVKGIAQDTTEKAIEEMKSAGAEIITIDQIKSEEETLPEKLEKKVQEIKEVAEAKLEEVISETGERISEAGEKLKKEVEKTRKKAEKVIKREQKKLKKKVEKTKKEVSKKVKKAVESVASMIGRVASKLKDTKKQKISEPKKKPLQKKKVQAKRTAHKGKISPGGGKSPRERKKGGGKTMPAKKSAAKAKKGKKTAKKSKK
ncbi:Nicotinamidase [bacterium HR19]|nr:Nicotinamidase [bacterium HR19]